MQLIKSKLLFVGVVYMSHVSISWEATGVFLQFNKNLGHFVFYLTFVLCARLHLLCVCPEQLQPDLSPFLHTRPWLKSFMSLLI